jgi:hypothetical protein
MMKFLKYMGIKMNMDSYANIAQILEAVILIASVFYLSLQLKQANQISRAETRRTMLMMDLKDISVGRDSPEIIGLWTKEELSQEEKVVFAHHLLITMRQREYEWQELQENAVDTDVFNNYAKVLSVHLGTQRSRSWWREFKEMYHPDFVSFVDSSIEGQPFTRYFEKYFAY